MSDGLACAVLSLRAQPGLVAATRSLLTQDPRPEVVVVNSGGGDPAADLARAGLEVPVVDVRERLYAGGARNRAIEATSARYVGFLAGDSTAEPGWVAGRLRAHAAGAEAVACALTSPPGASRSATAAHLLLNWRRMPGAEPPDRLLFGLSYDRRLFDRFGMFREDLRVGEDSDFNGRIGESVTIGWAPDVRTRHPGPERMREFLADQRRRGRRGAWARRSIHGKDPVPKLILDAALNPALALRQAHRTPDPNERRHLLRAWPMLLPGSVAYLAGGLAGRLP
jgi:glycosyltransferase involved in cell wall biosynthesis